ncbi:MAG: fibronectin type III domain-containing protein [Acidimicrobiales bacterium]
MLLALSLVAPITVLSPASALPGVVVDGGETVTYPERQVAVPIGGGITIDGGIYDGEYLEFDLGDGSATETLALISGDTPDSTAGVVSIVGTAVYLGNGTGADPVGSVDPVRNGVAGQPLRVNLASGFTNGGFETGTLAGWTAMNQRIDLGVTSIAGFVSQDHSTYPSDAIHHDDIAPFMGISHHATWVDPPANEGLHALTLSTFAYFAHHHQVVHGPAVYSDTFAASAGDPVSFDWRVQGSDGFHVFGYLLDQDGAQTTVLDAVSQSVGHSTPWTTEHIVVPSTGTYRIVFVGGVYNHGEPDGSEPAGDAYLMIDDVRAGGPGVDDGVAQQIARSVTYTNTSYDPPAQRTLTVTARSSSHGTGTGTVTIDVDLVDDPPALTAPEPVVFVNDNAVQTFDPVSGTLVASDPENDPITFALVGAVAEATTIDHVAYTHKVVGQRATVRIHSGTGTWLVIPHHAAINSTVVTASESFAVTATAKGLSDTQQLVVGVAIAESAPGAPSQLTAAPRDGSAKLTWTAPWWPGSGTITGYRIESSLDGVHWDEAIADTGSTSTTKIVSGFTNGVSVSFRVTALGTSGHGPASKPTTTVPRTTPGAPTILSVESKDRSAVVTFVAPTTDGGAPITGYQFSTDNGATWSTTRTLTADTPLTVFGLANGRAYPMRLRAVNDAGPGAGSAARTTTPVSAPVAPPTDDGPADLSVPPGIVRFVENDRIVTPTIEVVESTRVRISTDSFSVEMSGVDADGTPREVDDQGRIVVEEGTFVRVSGAGFEPFSTVDVWMFSTPTYLGAVTVEADGTFDATLSLPASIATGEHTLQLNGIGADGTNRSASLGIIVTEQVLAAPSVPRAATSGDVLPRTGGDATSLLQLGMVLVSLGLATVVFGGRRRSVGARR